MQKRVVFPKGKQKEFLVKSKKELKLTWPVLAKKLKLKRQTLEKAYRFEFCTLPYNTFTNICKIRSIPKNRVTKEYNIKVINFNPQAIIGRKVLGENKTNLQDINITFNKPITTFDTREITLNNHDKNKNLILPNKLTPELAEEIGMHVGDGFLSNKKFEYRLKGNKDEKQYYDYFIKPLYKSLYNLDISLKEYETTYGFELYSKSFWIFKNKTLGIPAGRKNNMKLPEVIKVDDINILCSFIRGVFDTDGSITFQSRYEFKKYYPFISITMLSKDLIDGIVDILNMLGLKPCRYRDKDGYWRINLNGYKRLEQYSKLIGWHNPKHLKKVKEWKKIYPKLGRYINTKMVAIV